MRFDNISIGKRLWWSSAILGALVAVLLGVSLWGLGSLANAAESASEHAELALAISDVEHHGAETAALQTMYAFQASLGVAGATSDDQGMRQRFLEGSATLDHDLQTLEAVMASHADTTLADKQLVDAFVKTYDEFKQTDARMVALYREGTPASIKAANELAISKPITVMTTTTGPLEEMSARSVADSVAALRDLDSAKNTTRSVLLITALITLALAIVLLSLVTRSITVPLRNIVELIRKMATGDLRGRLASPARDELGQMGAALNESLDRMSETIGGIESGAVSLSAASEELSVTSHRMSASSEESATQAAAVAAAAEQVSRSIQSVAATSEELVASEAEIARSAAMAAQVASAGVAAAGRANETVNALGESSVEIGEVVAVITSIAEQINLLALNATIEAARAGEVGKSFAVVADEVKDLARKTAQSSATIGRKVIQMQASAEHAVAAIGGITDVITRIDQLQSVVAAAVEEQATATNEISRGVNEAAAGSGEIARGIGDVSQVARDTSQDSSATYQAADDLARLAASLTGLVGKFQVTPGA